MTEKEKMLSGGLYNHYDTELTNDRACIAEKLALYNQLKDDEEKKCMLGDMLSKIGANVEIKTPFMCDYGYNIEVGSNVFVNYNCTILDCNKVVIGNNVLIAPNVQIYSATHPTDYKIRLHELEMAYPITIEDNVWIGGGTIICPGVKIGKNSVIGAGSVVVKDIPPNSIAVGNPCRVIKTLEEDECE
ncbi:MAG: sugar O-acetyltransferase [Lachnospiraceae bacterium]|nr:sugar O-acetyltransferase [Lachnospiraceae bacterium]